MFRLAMPRFAAVMAGLSAAIFAPGVAAADPVGLWTTPKATVRVADCGGALCATVTSLKEPRTPAGDPVLDIHNPDESKRSRPVVGLSFISAMKPDGDRWLGRIYNPEDGKTYKAYITEQADGALKVQGCALAGLACKTQIWKRSQ